MRNISFSLTTRQFRERTKDVTRRLGWGNLVPGDRLMACEKCMGRKPGEPLVRLGPIEIVSVRREPIRRLSADADYGSREIAREGFADHPTLRTPRAWVAWFCESHGCTPRKTVTRIEYRYIEATESAASPSAP